MAVDFCFLLMAEYMDLVQTKRNKEITREAKGNLALVSNVQLRQIKL